MRLESIIFSVLRYVLYHSLLVDCDSLKVGVLRTTERP